MAVAARFVDDAERPRTVQDVLRLLPDLMTSAGPPASLDPPLTPIECKYLMDEATPEEAREALALFGKRAEASPDGAFWTGFDDDDT